MPRIGFPLRFLALLIDQIFLLVLWFGLAFVWFFTAVLCGAREPSRQPFETAIWSLTLLYTLPELLWAASPGKFLLRLRIRHADGHPASLAQRFTRWSTKYFPLLFILVYLLTANGLAYAIAALMYTFVLTGCFFVFEHTRQTWHDKWSATAVYRLPPTPRATSSTVPPVASAHSIHQHA